MQEGELRRAPDEKDRASPSVVRPPPEKRKKTIAKAIKAKTLAPESQSTSTASMSSRSTSSAQASDGDSSSLRLDPSDPGTHHSEPKLESITLIVINEPKEEEDMSNDLRVSFKERHHKRLHEAIDMTHFPAKKTCPERV